jgi:hypothetical protein
VPKRRSQQVDLKHGLIAATIARHPREFVGFVMATAATLAIFINALFLQSGPHPAPIFATRPLLKHRPAVAASHIKAAAPESAPARKDAIATLIAPSKRVLAIQHALADFGYGQIKLTGITDDGTRAAIEKFERDRHLPVDGRISERFVRALAAMTGRSFEQ